MYLTDFYMSLKYWTDNVLKDFLRTIDNRGEATVRATTNVARLINIAKRAFVKIEDQYLLEELTEALNDLGKNLTCIGECGQIEAEMLSNFLGDFVEMVSKVEEA